jgi:hypothetical protein
MEYYQLEPWGERRADLRAGTIAAVLVNGNPHRSENARSVKPEDFFPTLSDNPGGITVQPLEEMKLAAMQMAAMLGGRQAPMGPNGVRIMNPGAK